ncbi:type IV secretion system protein [Pseudomonas rossensis]|uniref:type IV secretion system protein n=1 Tax=Pseudomonas rossensis TaxID=2305471 RepID=UPI0032604008
MDVQVVQPIFDAIDAAMSGTLINGTSKLIQVAGAIFGSMWLAHFTLKSIGWLFQGMDMIFRDVIFSMLKMAFICGCAFNISWYMETIVPFVSNAPAGITQLLSGSESHATNMIDALIGAYINSVIEIVNSLDFSLFNSDLSNLAAAIITLGVLIISGLAFLGVCVANLIVLKLATTLFLVLGPLFIAFFLFDATKQYAWGWINILAGFMLSNVLFGVVISIEINYINSNVLGADGQFKAGWVSILSIPLIFGAFAVLAQTLPNYAASVMSGSPAGNGGGLGAMLKHGGLGAGKQMGGALMKKFMPKGPSIQ